MNCKIDSIKAIQVLDSRGNPTVSVEVRCGEKSATACAPSGASTGKYEAHELRDGLDSYGGKSVTRAVNLINTEISDMLTFKSVLEQRAIDKMLTEADGTENKSRFGANGTLAVSLAVAKCAAKVSGLPFYRYIGGTGARSLPRPMLNVLNGGRHADNGLDIQEFMIIPKKDEFPIMLERSVAVYFALRSLLKEKGLAVNVGDEGGFAPNLNNTEEALDALCQAIDRAGFKSGEDFFIGLDVAASEFIKNGSENYRMEKSERSLSADELSEYYKSLINSYPIISIEDPFGEEDFPAWQKFTSECGQINIVGDDLFVTNTERIKKGTLLGAANTVLIKPNQIGTLTETLEAIETAKKAGFKIILSHRSGETCDTSIADIAVAVNADMIKSGAPARSERTAKYNRLLRIYNDLR